MFRFVKLLALVALAPVSNADCLAPKALTELDYQYEQALRTGDREFLQQLLLPDFVWVHNHAVAHESKADLLARLGPDYQTLKSREPSDVKVIRTATTAVIHGLSTVDKFTDGPRHANSYRFMRTYVKHGDECRLLAGQTMKVWSTETDN
ncbi:nuclear transport factor 2 family protein [Gilvimarinus sp. DA14]|uniref:nuclear transport factor 2 family protein n=1 Tax=Gilvimarinus sp. DA14 TaxID=2956798 RepID=UPI0020B67002|nr:nuclear transport factor 2 family protein [Gilvimarinus sp. DA14]UTF59260.1 nuclear transport factor 2 family protein [Gilvimarinus sp. DA14]